MAVVRGDVVGGLVAGLVAIGLGACFDFDATEDGGAPSGDAGDARTSEVDAGGGDAPRGPPGDASDGSVATSEAGDAPLGADAGTDGAASGSFCASLARPDGGAFFCDDFDEHAIPGASWSTYDEQSGTLTETDAAAESKPISVDETVDALLLGQQLDIALRTPVPLPAPPATLRFGFALEPVQIDTTANAAIVLGAVDFFDAENERYTVELAINIESGAPALALGEQSGLADGAMPYENHPLPPQQPLLLGTFTDLVIEIDWTAPGTAEAKVLVNGGQELDVPLTMTVTPTALQIGIGTSYVSEPSPVWELRYDDVWFTAE